MTEFEAFKNMIVSMLTYMSVSEKPDESGAKFYDEKCVSDVKGLLDCMPNILQGATLKAFKEVFLSDYRRDLNNTIKALTTSLQTLLQEEKK